MRTIIATVLLAVLVTLVQESSCQSNGAGTEFRGRGTQWWFQVRAMTVREEYRERGIAREILTDEDAGEDAGAGHCRQAVG